jgi:hypothetical protein
MMSFSLLMRVVICVYVYGLRPCIIAFSVGC